MTKYQFFDAMQSIDPVLIERADKVKKNKSPVLKITAIAAVLALIAGAVAVVLPLLMSEEPPQKGDRIVWGNIFGDNSKIQSNAEVCQRAFAEILNEDYSAYRKDYTISAELIGEKIADTDMRTGWRWEGAYDGKEEDVVIAKAEIYAIKNVDPNAAVAVKYLDGEDPTGDSAGCYYAARNSKYHFESLEGFFNDFNVKDHIRINEDSLIYKKSRDAYYYVRDGKYKLNDNGRKELADLLLHLNADAVVSGWYDAVDDSIIKNCGGYVAISAQIDTAGTRHCFFYILDNGYIALKMENMNETAFFNVGKEITDEFFDTVRDNGELISAPIPNEGLVEESTRIG